MKYLVGKNQGGSANGLSEADRRGSREKKEKGEAPPGERGEERFAFRAPQTRPRRCTHSHIWPVYLALTSPSKPYILFMLIVSWLPRDI